MALSNKAVKISQKHLLGIQDLSISDVELILNEAKTFISLNKSKNKKLDILRGKTQINLLSSQIDTPIRFEPRSKPNNRELFSIFCFSSLIVIILFFLD